MLSGVRSGAAARDLPAGSAPALRKANRWPSELSRAMETIVDKVRELRGRRGRAEAPAGLIAAFRPQAAAHARYHAAFAAIAIQTVAARAQQENPARPAVTVALHTELVKVGRHREGVAALWGREASRLGRPGSFG